MGPGCDPGLLANEISDNYDQGVSRCCQAVITAVDTKGCLCPLSTERTMINDVGITRVLQLYRECGVICQLPDDSNCDDVQNNDQATCPPPPPPGAKDTSRSRNHVIDVATLVVVVIILAFVLGAMGWFLYRRTYLQHRMTFCRIDSLEQAQATQAYIAMEMARLLSDQPDGQPDVLRLRESEELLPVARV